MINWNYRIHRESLYRLLGLGHQIPKDFSARFEGVSIPSYYNRPSSIPGQWTIIVKPGTVRFNSSVHRIFVACKCGREIPTGRFHQHMPYCK